MKKIALMLALLMTLLCVFASCGKKESGGLVINTDSASGTGTQIVTGLTDETYTLPANITKIVSLSPAASLILDNLGASSKLIGVDSVSAGLISASVSTVDASGAAALAPEVIFVDEASKAALGATDIPVFTVPVAQSVADVNQLTRICGKIAGVNADDAVSKVTNVENVAQLGSSAYSTKLTAYLDLGDGETVGGGTYISEILYATGLENICTIDGFGTMSEADVVAANPEFIFTVGSADAYLNNAAFADVTAIVKKQVFSIEKKDIRWGSNNVSNAISTMYENVSSTRGDE